MKLTVQQQRKINATCRRFQQQMQKCVDKKGSGVDSISITACGKTTVVAEKGDSNGPNRKQG